MWNWRSMGSRAGLPAAVAATLLLLIGCEVSHSVVGGPDPIPIGPIGPVVANPNGGPPVECRGIPIVQCQDSAPGALARNDVVRVVVTCTKVCTPAQGEFRIDLVTADGRMEQSGGGGYASGAAMPAPAPVEPNPAPSG